MIFARQQTARRPSGQTREPEVLRAKPDFLQAVERLAAGLSKPKESGRPCGWDSVGSTSPRPRRIGQPQGIERRFARQKLTHIASDLAIGQPLGIEKDKCNI